MTRSTAAAVALSALLLAASGPAFAQQTRTEQVCLILCNGNRRRAPPSFGPWATAYECETSRPSIADCQMSVSRY
jgi:hypothetical protein